MSTTMQLSDLQLAVRQRADMVGSQFISDSELTSYINQSYFELYDLLVQEYGDNYFVAPRVTFQTDGVNDQFALPDGTAYSGAPALLKLLGVDLVLGNCYVSLKQFNFSERNRFMSFNQAYGHTNLHYRLNGSKLWLAPKPKGGQTIQLWYVPRLSPLASPTDTADGISGWTEYIIVDCAIKCLAKEESDPSVFMAQKQALIQRIQAAAENRDAATSSTVSDVRGYDTFSGFYEGAD